MSYMSYNCYSLKSIDLSSFNTSNVNNMSYMFSECYSLKSIDLSSFNTSNVKDFNLDNIFYGCKSLNKKILKLIKIIIAKIIIINIEVFYKSKSLILKIK